MKKLSQGFTLAEILIALGIIGVVSALTLPALFGSFTSATFGTALARSVERLELGFRNAIESANKNLVERENATLETLEAINLEDLFEADEAPATQTELLTADGRTLFVSAGAIIGTETATNIDNYSYTNFNGGEVAEFAVDADTTPYKIKKLNTIIYYRGVENLNNPTASTMVGRILIDVNGTERPNRAGRDVFLYGLRNDGRLVPAGSAEYNEGFDDSTVALAENGCAGENADITDGLSCTARVQNEEWKTTYIK